MGLLPATGSRATVTEMSTEATRCLNVCPQLYLYPEWTRVTSGVPQGSVLGPVLSIICINDIDLGFNNFISKFADDTKIGNAVLSEDDRLSLQKDLHKISDLSVKWGIPLYINKCLILQVRSRNIKNYCEMRCVKIESVHSVKELGISVTSNLLRFFFLQYNESVIKANRMMGLNKIFFIQE